MAGRPPLDLHQKVRELVQHSCAADLGIDAPISNFELRTNSALNLIRYIENGIQKKPYYQAVYDRHMGLLQLRVLGSLVEAFERFVKETAIVCVDAAAQYTIDDRFDNFSIRTGSLASQFSAGSIGRALCESDTWLNNSGIDERFRQFLKPHFGKVWTTFLFPNEKQNNMPQVDRDRAKTLSILWQVRHNITHNTGYLTDADAKKLTLLTKIPVAGRKTLCPDLDDLRYVKSFLNETAQDFNTKVGARLAELLSELYADDGTLFDSQTKANEISVKFQTSVVVAGMTGAF